MTRDTPAVRHRPRPRLAALGSWIGLAALCTAAAPAGARPAEIHGRDDATAIVAELRRIHTPEGLEILEAVELGGTRQWISIRGRHRDNPVLLFVHGGWGDPMIGQSWAFQTPWEDFFTVVQWDQRGGGKNAASADADTLRATFTVERLARDAEELVAHLRARLGKEKVVVLGYSLGGLVGVHLAKRRPEWLHAYVGVGQVSHDLERALYERTLELARAAGNAEAVAELEPLAAYPQADDGSLGAGPRTTRKWALAFGGGWYGKRDWQLYADLPALAPEYSAEDVARAWNAVLWLNSAFFERTRHDLRELGADFEVPVLLFHGRHDLTPPIGNARAYFDWIRAPHKRFVTFERSAHVPFMEEPGRFFAALLTHVLPLTEGAADYESPR